MGMAKRNIAPGGPFLFHESVVRYQHSYEELVNRYDGRIFRRAIEAGGGLETGVRGSGPVPNKPVDALQGALDVLGGVGEGEPDVSLAEPAE